MQTLFSRPFDRLDESDLRDLVEVRRVREHIQLEYKQESYNHNHDGAVEMLADVTAMANAQGGYILIGIEEDKAEPQGTPKSLVGIRGGDAEAKWIQSVCLSSIDETIPGLQVRDVLIAGAVSCVAIQIPNSIRKPHMVVHERHRSFRMRHGRDKSFMGMQEVRNMILSMNIYRASLAEFLADRNRVLKEEAKSEPWLLLMATPIYVDNDKLNPLRSDIRDILEKVPGNPDRENFPDGIRVGKPQPRIFGVEATNDYDRESRRHLRYLRLFRNGHLEYCANFISRGVPDGWPQKAMQVYPAEMTVMLLHFLEVAKQVMELGEISEPIALTMHLENFNSSYLKWWAYDHDSADMVRFGRAIIWSGSSLNLEFTATELSNPESLAHTMIDRLFTAFGSEPKDNRFFDAEGHFVKN